MLLRQPERHVAHCTGRLRTKGERDVAPPLSNTKDPSTVLGRQGGPVLDLRSTLRHGLAPDVAFPDEGEVYIVLLQRDGLRGDELSIEPGRLAPFDWSGLQ